jgi:eukaryotic-like serine/threonine-protein kinase
MYLIMSISRFWQKQAVNVAEQPRKDIGLKEIGGFELISKIGQGGMGAVFKARQKSLDRIVALKVLPPSIAKDAKFIERFQREARACAKLNHPNIVQGVDVGKDEASGVWYFAMEFIDGPSVLKALKTDGPIPETRALEIARDVARALECAASHGIVHRDIKPDNILLTANGDAKLADLGLAKQMNDDASLTQSGQAVGTPFYMAPEQVRGASAEIDIRTDLYALGGTLFHLVTGKPPFSGETSALIMSRHLTDPAPKANKINPEVSEGCSRLIEKLMQKDRDQRVQSPGELIAQSPVRKQR